MPLADTYTGDTFEMEDFDTSFQDESQPPPQSMNPGSWARSGGGNTLNVAKAQRIIKAFTDDPSWLADPRTAHAANSVFSAASKVVGMHIQLERLNSQAEAAKGRNTTANQIGSSLLKLAEGGGDGAEWASQWYAPGENGKSKYEDPSTWSEILKGYKQYAKPTTEAQSTTGKEVADRMALEKQFGANSPQVKKFDELSAKASTPSNLGKLLEERRNARPDEKGYYDQAIGHLGQKMGISIQYDDQGRPIINYGPQKTSIGDPSVATQSMAQKKLLKYEAASELINNLQKNMSSGDVGLSGVLGEYVGDRILPQLGIDTFKGQRADVRSTMIAARESLLREISDDSRFSNLDREEISKALPSSGVFESLPNAQQRLTTVRNILNARGRTYSEGLGLKQPEWSLSPDEIKALYEKNQATGGKEGISFEKAQSLLERFHHFTP